MKYVIQIENKKSENLQKNFYEHSSLMQDKYRLSLAVVRETRVAIFHSSKKNALQDRPQSSYVVNRISSEIIKYNAEIYKLTREALQHQAKEAKLTRKEISIQATTASRIEKCQGQKTRADELDYDLA